MIPQLTKTEIIECMNDIKRDGKHGLRGIERKQCLQILDELYLLKENESKKALDCTKYNLVNYPYPSEYKNGREYDYWLEKTKYKSFEIIENYINQFLQDFDQGNTTNQKNQPIELIEGLPQIQSERKRGRPPGSAKCLNDFLVDRENDNYIIPIIKDEYKTETLESIYYCILVLSKIGKFNEKALGNITCLSEVIKTEFCKGTRANLTNVINGITKNLENDKKYQMHKARVTKLFSEK